MVQDHQQVPCHQELPGVHIQRGQGYQEGLEPQSVPVSLYHQVAQKYQAVLVCL